MLSLLCGLIVEFGTVSKEYVIHKQAIYRQRQIKEGYGKVRTRIYAP